MVANDETVVLFAEKVAPLFFLKQIAEMTETAALIHRRLYG